MPLVTKNDLIKKYGDVMWVCPHDVVVPMIDPDNVAEINLVEKSASIGGASWAEIHYRRSKGAVKSIRREGNLLIYRISPGRYSEKLVASKSASGIFGAEIDYPNKKIYLRYRGLAGGGLGATMSRAMARGCIGIEIDEIPGGSKEVSGTLVFPIRYKVTIGVDDTDNSEQGATWSLAHRLAQIIDRKGIGIYLYETLVQLYPEAPQKTKNCVSTAVTFGVEPENVNLLIKKFSQLLKKETLSDNTVMAVYNHIIVSDSLKEYGLRVKKGIVTIEEAERAANSNSVDIYRITGENGLIGALAAVSYESDFKNAVLLPS